MLIKIMSGQDKERTSAWSQAAVAICAVEVE